MTWMAFISVVACFATAGFVALRAELLRPRLRNVDTAPWPVRLLLDMTAFTATGRGLEIIRGGEVTLFSTLFIVTCALASCGVLVAMVLKGWASVVVRTDKEARLETQAEDADVVRTALRQAAQDLVPPALRKLAEMPDPWNGEPADPPEFTKAVQQWPGGPGRVEAR